MCKKYKQLFSLLLVVATITVQGFSSRGETVKKERVKKETPMELFGRKRTNFVLKDGDECKLINSAIKQDYRIHFSGSIEQFDTLLIGKGEDRYLASSLQINRDSIVVTIVTSVKKRRAYKHNLKLVKDLEITIDRKVNDTFVTIVNDNDTVKLEPNFVGMHTPFIRSVGSVLKVKEFEFSCADYDSDVYVFGDSYVNCGSSSRWPYYLYKKGYQFFCDGLPGAESVDSYGFIKSAFTVHKPKYVIWCLGMNDLNKKFTTNESWEYYIKEVMKLCSENNATLILSTIPSVPLRDHTGKNKFVRESGYRYIDFDKAVSDGKGTWKEGLLSKDGVHPSKKGAKAMADEFVKEFPEIEQYL